MASAWKSSGVSGETPLAMHSRAYSTSLSEYMPDDGDLLNLREEWVPNAAQRHGILVDHPAALYSR